MQAQGAVSRATQSPCPHTSCCRFPPREGENYLLRRGPLERGGRVSGPRRRPPRPPPIPGPIERGVSRGTVAVSCVQPFRWTDALAGRTAVEIPSGRVTETSALPSFPGWSGWCPRCVGTHRVGGLGEAGPLTVPPFAPSSTDQITSLVPTGGELAAPGHTAPASPSPARPGGRPLHRTGRDCRRAAGPLEVRMPLRARRAEGRACQVVT